MSAANRKKKKNRTWHYLDEEPQPLLTPTDQPPVACSDQVIIYMASLWDGFFFYVCTPIFFFSKKEKHVPFCWDNHFDYGLRQSLYMKSHQIINIECEYCYKGNK